MFLCFHLVGIKGGKAVPVYCSACGSTRSNNSYADVGFQGRKTHTPEAAGSIFPCGWGSPTLASPGHAEAGVKASAICRRFSQCPSEPEWDEQQLSPRRTSVAGSQHLACPCLYSWWLPQNPLGPCYSLYPQRSSDSPCF